jgi:hypothetical protein
MKKCITNAGNYEQIRADKARIWHRPKARLHQPLGGHSKQTAFLPMSPTLSTERPASVTKRTQTSRWHMTWYYDSGCTFSRIGQVRVQDVPLLRNTYITTNKSMLPWWRLVFEKVNNCTRGAVCATSKITGWFTPNSKKESCLLSPCVSKHHTKKYDADVVAVQLHAFLSSTLDGGDWPASRFGRFITRERVQGTHWTGSWTAHQSRPERGCEDKIPGGIWD